ncbi:MAG: hypothetical protein ACYTKD_24625 [Planctomycetota bacterium]|jgi:hypothetical protein
MAARLPRPLRRREILYGIDTPPETLSGLADAYLQEGLVFDAVDFFAQAGDRDGLGHVKKLAIETGDAFLLRGVKEAVPDLVEKADWDELARAAKSLGKDAYAGRAEAGGAPPPPPLQEELVHDEEALAGEAEEDRAGGPSKLRPSQAAKATRKREIQGG